MLANWPEHAGSMRGMKEVVKGCRPLRQQIKEHVHPQKCLTMQAQWEETEPIEEPLAASCSCSSPTGLPGSTRNTSSPLSVLGQKISLGVSQGVCDSFKTATSVLLQLVRLNQCKMAGLSSQRRSGEAKSRIRRMSFKACESLSFGENRSIHGNVWPVAQSSIRHLMPCMPLQR